MESPDNFINTARIEQKNKATELQTQVQSLRDKALIAEKGRSTRNILLFFLVLFLIAGVVILSYYNIDNYNKIETKDEDTETGYYLSIGFVSALGFIILILCIHFIDNRGYLHIHRDVFFPRKKVIPPTAPYYSYNYNNPMFQGQPSTSPETPSQGNPLLHTV
tara:strand:- start:3464 stop:3952 length:489 start_codon:yes stop_codon:yes gene_type:complete